jgi:hypothetical protein
MDRRRFVEHFGKMVFLYIVWTHSPAARGIKEIGTQPVSTDTQLGVYVSRDLKDKSVQLQEQEAFGVLPQ